MSQLHFVKRSQSRRFTTRADCLTSTFYSKQQNCVCLVLTSHRIGKGAQALSLSPISSQVRFFRVPFKSLFAFEFELVFESCGYSQMLI